MGLAKLSIPTLEGSDRRRAAHCYGDGKSRADTASKITDAFGRFNVEITNGDGTGARLVKKMRAIVWAALAVLTGCSAPPRVAACDQPPEANSYLLEVGATPDHEIQAIARAQSCIHRAAYTFAGAAASAEAVAAAVMGNCQDLVFNAQATSYSTVVESGVTVLPPPGFRSIRRPTERSARAPESESPAINAAAQRIAERTRRELAETAMFRVVQARAGRCAVPG